MAVCVCVASRERVWAGAYRVSVQLWLLVSAQGPEPSPALLPQQASAVPALQHTPGQQQDGGPPPSLLQDTAALLYTGQHL